MKSYNSGQIKLLDKLLTVRAAHGLKTDTQDITSDSTAEFIDAEF